MLPLCQVRTMVTMNRLVYSLSRRLHNGINAATPMRLRLESSLLVSVKAPRITFNSRGFSSALPSVDKARISTQHFPAALVAVAALFGVSAGYQYAPNSDTFLPSILQVYAESNVSSQSHHTARSANSSATASGTSREISRAEVAKHHTLGDVWVTFQGGVYDISEFVASHPGGDKILLAAGGSLEPFWSMYAVHLADEVQEILCEYRIGSLPKNELLLEPDLTDPFSREPDRSNLNLTVNTNKPFNAEAKMSSLVSADVTSNDNFFVRNHLPVPKVELSAYTLEVTGDGIESKHFTLDELKSMPKQSVRVTIQCAGNRRASMHEVSPVRGLLWGQGAISTAEWSGVPLRYVLLAQGVKENQDSIKHVHFEGLDSDMERSYGASIPVDKALSVNGDVILAYEMNGEPIPADHGFPLRVVVPGTVGARNVKWLSRISTSDKESDSHWQRYDYKGFCPTSNWDNLDYDKAPAIQDLPVQSAIARPLPGETVRGKVLNVEGYAVSGGGREIVRVDVSFDGAKTWKEAKLSSTDQKVGHHWAKRRWKVTIEMPEPDKSGDIEIVCKATDRSFNSQPERFEPIYNVRGVLCNAWHRVKVKRGSR